MKVKFFKNEPNLSLSPEMNVCLNRGIQIEDIDKYLSNSFDDINNPEEFNEELLKEGLKLIVSTIKNNKKMCFIVDSDVDGFASSAILINYLYELFPSYVEQNIDFLLHEGKGHGLPEFIDKLETQQYELVICPDSATNDHKEIERLYNVGTKVFILDHHLSEEGYSPYAVVINSQYNYPNPSLCGGGVVLKFCQYIDKVLEKNIAYKFKDLAALALQSDMMDITNLETKEMIFEGLTEEAIINPLLYSICKKNEFALNKADYVPSSKNNLKVSPMGVSFFVTPLLNAVCRSGTMEEKELVFRAMLTKDAFKEILSTKRGHKLGEMETIVTQVTRQITNIKNRQEKNVEAGMEILTHLASDMLDNKVLVFSLDENYNIPSEIKGLCANKLMAKYQRPVCIVSELEDGSYAGSMRGYTATGIDNFKEIAETSDSCSWCRGHENAAGICLNDPESFVLDMNNKLNSISTEMVHYVDYIFDNDNIDPEVILSLAKMNDYIGTNFPRPMVHIKNVCVSDYMIMKDSHLKINLNNNVSAILWNFDEDVKNALDNFNENGKIFNINFIAKCNINEWNYSEYPQLIITDYEIIEDNSNIINQWGF